jgi:hypothetical protein
MHMATDSAGSNNWINSFPNKTPWTRHAEESLRGASQTGGKKEVCEMHDAVEAERCLKLMNKIDEYRQSLSTYVPIPCYVDVEQCDRHHHSLCHRQPVIHALVLR